MGSYQVGGLCDIGVLVGKCLCWFLLIAGSSGATGSMSSEVILQRRPFHRPTSLLDVLFGWRHLPGCIVPYDSGFFDSKMIWPCMGLDFERGGSEYGSRDRRGVSDFYFCRRKLRPDMPHDD
eukprot:IDg14615t1